MHNLALFFVLVFLLTPMVEDFSTWFWRKIGWIDIQKLRLELADQIILDLYFESHSDNAVELILKWKEVRGKHAISELKTFETWIL